MLNPTIQSFTQKRHSLGLSLRDLEKITGVSTSMLQRFESKTGHLDIENLAAIDNWVGEQVTEGAIITYPTNMFSAICAVIKSDPNLSPTAAECLCELMRGSYEELTK